MTHGLSEAPERSRTTAVYSGPANGCGRILRIHLRRGALRRSRSPPMGSLLRMKELITIGYPRYDNLHVMYNA
jgi:hypothetical protein